MISWWGLVVVYQLRPCTLRKFGLLDDSQRYFPTIYLALLSTIPFKEKPLIAKKRRFTPLTLIWSQTVISNLYNRKDYSSYYSFRPINYDSLLMRIFTKSSFLSSICLLVERSIHDLLTKFVLEQGYYWRQLLINKLNQRKVFEGWNSWKTMNYKSLSLWEALGYN